MAGIDITLFICKTDGFIFKLYYTDIYFYALMNAQVVNKQPRVTAQGPAQGNGVRLAQIDSSYPKR